MQAPQASAVGAASEHSEETNKREDILKPEEFLEEAANKKVPAKVIGRTGGSSLDFGPAVKVPLDVLTAASFNQLPEALGQGTVSA